MEKRVREWGFQGERRRMARQFSLIRYRWAAAGPVIALLPLALMSLGGWGQAVYSWIESQVGSGLMSVVLGTMVLYAAFFAWASIWAIPAYLTGKRFGLTTSTPQSWARDRLVAAAVGLPLVTGSAIILSQLLNLHPSQWWWRWWIVWALATALGSYIFPVLVLPLFHRLRSLEAGSLRERLLELGTRTATAIRDIHVVDLSRRTRAANAFVTGLGRTRRIVLGDNLVDQFTDGEVEAVLAHELAHHRQRHVPMSVVRSLATGMLVALALSQLVPGAARLTGHAWPGDAGILTLVAFFWALLGMIVAPLENAISRRQERSCDAFALSVIQDPSDFAAAMVRLGDSNLADLCPPPLARYMLMGHPSIMDRLEMARAAGAEPSIVRRRLAVDCGRLSVEPITPDSGSVGEASPCQQ